MMRLALIGLGRWGTNIKRTLEGITGIEVTVLKRDDTIAVTSSHIRAADGVLIATPGSTHAEIALPFIKMGLPVFVEKPMTTSLKDAHALQKAAAKSGSQVFVGHVHLYNPAFLKAKTLIQKAGRIRYMSFEGMNWGPFREDMSAWWDWAPHDISMALDVLGQPPKSVQAWGTFDWAQAQLTFPKDISVLIRVTWLSPQKRKSLTVVGKNYTVVLDDTKPSRKVAIFRDGKVSHPAYGATMPLTAELKAFITIIKTGKAPKTNIQNGVDVVRVLDAAERSIKRDGAKITL